MSTDIAIAAPPPLPSTTDDAHARCENCGTALQGEFCHACGQSTHSPVRSLGHAVEEVFEAFWHLDGRVFRTLRDLWVPGRVAMRYLAGQRVRYIAPLRLFVVLSLLTFFVAKLTLHVEVNGDPIQVRADDAQMEAATTVAEVEARRDALLAEVRAARRTMPNGAPVPGVEPALVAAEVAINKQAGDRIAALREQGEAAGSASDGRTAVAGRTAPAADGDPAERRPTAGGAADASATAGTEVTRDFDFGDFTVNGKPWDPKSNPLVIDGWPDFMNRWANRKFGQAKRNLELARDDPDLLVQKIVGAIPAALFLLMPVFALLLKIVHVGTRRLYLEHFVVALYSHAWMLLALLAACLLEGLTVLWPSTAVDVVASLAQVLLLVFAVPVYLFVMQHRIYRAHWLVTTVRYVVIGNVYFVLVAFVALYAAVAGISA